MTDEFWQSTDIQAQLRAVHDAYRAQPFRMPICAGGVYPADPAELNRYLEAFSQGDHTLSQWGNISPRGIISPHIDYGRGGRTYAKVWQRARNAVQQADRIIILGTDHYSGGQASITLSHLPYATPYGILPKDETLVAELETAVGIDHAYQRELFHKKEHSIELSAVWIHHLRPTNPCPVIPIVVGSFYHLTPNDHPSTETRIERIIQTLQKALIEKPKTLIVASVDLCHVGPAFETPPLATASELAVLKKYDDVTRGSIMAGDAEGFYQHLAVSRNAKNVCGFSPIYILLRALGETTGLDIGYEQCVADQASTSYVSICGMLLS